MTKNNFKKTGLFKCQYSPREKAIKCNLTPKALKKWKKLSTSQRVKVIDRLQSKGVFG